MYHCSARSLDRFCGKFSISMVLSICLVIGVMDAAFATTRPESNGTRWREVPVCYRIDSTAIGFATDIDAAGQAWTSASQGGFAFSRDLSGTSCPNYVAEGYLDGPKGWYGMTLIETNNGLAGCDPLTGCKDPSPGSDILNAHTIIEDIRCGSEQGSACVCNRGPVPMHDPLGCRPVLPGTIVLCGAVPPGNTVLTTLGLRWDTPGAYETILHEFGHWLWLKDYGIAFPFWRQSAMDWLNPQRCTDPALPPDFYTLFGGDIYALNELYP